MANLCPCCNQPVRPEMELDESYRFLRYRGRMIDLTGYEAKFLKLLLSQPGELFTLEVIKDHLWPVDIQDRPEFSLQVVRNLVFHLNQKLAGSGLSIRNKPRLGYRLVVSDLPLPVGNSQREARVV